jgi:hypothetical protein
MEHRKTSEFKVAKFVPIEKRSWNAKGLQVESAIRGSRLIYKFFQRAERFPWLYTEVVYSETVASKGYSLAGSWESHVQDFKLGACQENILEPSHGHWMLVANLHLYRMNIWTSDKAHQKLAVRVLHLDIIRSIANEELFDIKFAIRPVLAKNLIDYPREWSLPIFPTMGTWLEEVKD